MARPLAVILVVGLSRSLLGEHSPQLNRLIKAGSLRTLEPVLPAVTCSVQASMTTGLPVSRHGVVGNGWYDRELGEVHFWKQSSALVRGEKVWETAKRRDASVTCANVCWWFAMNSSVDVTVTPRPIYKADGRKLPDCYTQPAGWRDELQAELGRFPLFQFWGPGASIVSTRWITDAALLTKRKFDPTLSLVYLPHLDYALQKLGPGHAEIAQRVGEVDAEVGRLAQAFEGNVLVVSEYGIESVDGAVMVNRALREAGYLKVREEEGGEVLDPMGSEAFAVCDHQVAQVYGRVAGGLAQFCRELPGVERVLGQQHPRGGDLTLVAAPGKWFAYPYWLHDAKAPDFAPTVDIHRKPGYDPLELFLDPRKSFIKARLAGKLLRKRLGFRTLMDVVPLDTSLVRGSHGRVESAQTRRPVMIAPRELELPETISCTGVRDVILSLLFGDTLRG